VLQRTRLIIASGAAGLLALTGGGIALAANDTHNDLRGDDDGEQEITGEAFDRASAAALAETGGGRVTGAEVGDEESYYEVEVTLADGSQVDVQLDESFTVVGTEHDAPDGSGSTNDADEVED
jgi:uncharacterized membrane protein YkoI